MKIFVKSSLIVLAGGLLLTLLLGGCKTIDLRNDYAMANDDAANRAKGRELLQKTYLAMGYDQLEKVTAYEAESLFTWNGFWSMMPMNSLPGNKGNRIRFRFNTHTFDGQVTFLEGRKEGKTFGLQSWEAYRFDEGEPARPKNNKRYTWGLATYHYIIEGPMRLLGADIVRYAGETERDGQTYDLVYATWGQDAPHKEHDQWLLYINRATGITELTEVTINDFFVPVPNGMKGATIQFERQPTSIGAYLPSFVTIQLGKPKAKDKYVYTFTLEDYTFDTYPETELYPLPGVDKLGDRKPTEDDASK